MHRFFFSATIFLHFLIIVYVDVAFLLNFFFVFNYIYLKLSEGYTKNRKILKPLAGRKPGKIIARRGMNFRMTQVIELFKNVHFLILNFIGR